MIRFLIAFVLWAGLTPSAQADCQPNLQRWRFQQQSSGSMVVTSGTTCRISVRAGGRTEVKGIKIIARPKNGTVSPTSIGAAYRSRPGFKGSDQFTFGVIGHAGDIRGTATIVVSVTVN